MSRGLTAGIVTELQATTKSPFFLLYLETASSTLRYSTLGFDISWSSQTWLGNGYVQSIDPIRESTEQASQGAVVTLKAEPSALISLALSDLRQNKPANIYLGFLNASLVVIADPFPIFTGKLDKSELVDTPDSSTLKLFIESNLIDFSKSPGHRYNHESQQALFAGDLGFEYVEQLQTGFQGYWGKSKKKPGKRKGRRNKR